MNRNWWWKFGFLVVTIVWSLVYITPTFGPSLLKWDVANSSFPFKQKINLGLDLQGGLYMVLGADFNKVFNEIVDRQATSVEGRLRDKGIPVKSVKVVREGYAVDDPRIAVEFDPANRDKIHDLVKAEYWTLRMAGEAAGRLEFGLSREHRTEVRENTINQSIEVIRNRIDEFGVSEPAIASQGTDRIVVELPGVREIERAKSLIGSTAKLEFKIVDDERMNQGQVAAIVAEIEKSKGISYKEGSKFSEYVKAINDNAQGKLPEGTEIAFEKADAPGQPTQYIPYALISKADVTGDDLADAQVMPDPETRRPEVNFSMNPRGAITLQKLTEANKGRRMAIVLDNMVKSAPVIQSAISNSGRITLGTGNYDDILREARDLAIVLRAGALPAQLEFLEQRVVGPSLGQDSIRGGITAGVIGSLLVFVFITFYYRTSGLIAVVSLVLNVLFVLAILVGMEATLTLPGIAGIALTVGIAVDSNVVMYERIREELRAGKGPHAAVDAGFQKAFRTILDANVTNAAAAVVLFMYGTGPIKGFAVTMLIGIVTTLFTAVFVCKLLFDAYLRKIETTGAKALSI
jgi:preprotein translocase subunit SecD